MLHDASRNVMRLHIMETREPAFGQLPAEIPIEGSISGWVWQNQPPVVVRGVDQENRFCLTQTLREKLPVKSVCSLPLTTVHQRLGVLNFFSNRVGAYNQLDLEFAQLMAAQIAVVVDNAFNFEEAQGYQRQLLRERDRSALLLDVNNMLVSNLNLRELLSALSACLSRSVPHDVAGLALYDPALDQLRVKRWSFRRTRISLLKARRCHSKGIRRASPLRRARRSSWMAPSLMKTRCRTASPPSG